MMISNMLRLTERIIRRRHQLLKITDQLTNQLNHVELQKSQREYLAEAEVKPGEKSWMVIDHLAQGLVPYKVTFSIRSRRTYDYTKGTLITVNVLMS